jgi:hypothetical protein
VRSLSSSLNSLSWPRFIRAWLLEHGRADQIERFDAGVLPPAEYLEPMESQAFEPWAGVPRFEKITEEEAYCAGERGRYPRLPSDSVTFRAVDATTVPADVWNAQKELRALGECDTKVRLHTSHVGKHSRARHGIQVRVQFGPFRFTREYAAESRHDDFVSGSESRASRSPEDISRQIVRDYWDGDCWGYQEDRLVAAIASAIKNARSPEGQPLSES